jgi:hypothetical protein
VRHTVTGESYVQNDDLADIGVLAAEELAA